MKAIITNKVKKKEKRKKKQKKTNNKNKTKNPKHNRKKKLGNGGKKVFIPLTGSLAIMNIPNHDIARNGRSPPYTRVHRLPGSGCKCQHFVECSSLDVTGGGE